MNKKFVCYCGLYCENCAVKAKVEPAAKNLYDTMKNAGFEEVINLIPGGEGFWPFLKNMAVDGMCISCQEGSGDPDCKIRACAKSKNVEVCVFCKEYPCDKLDFVFKYTPSVRKDNEVLREKG